MALKLTAAAFGTVALGFGLLWRASARVSALPRPPVGSLLDTADSASLTHLPHVFKDAFVVTIATPASLAVSGRSPRKSIDLYAERFFSSWGFFPERLVLPFIVPDRDRAVKVAEVGTYHPGDVHIPGFRVLSKSLDSYFPAGGTTGEVLFLWSTGEPEAKVGGYTWLAVTTRGAETDLWFGSGICSSRSIWEIPRLVMIGHSVYSRMLLHMAARQFE